MISTKNLGTPKVWEGSNNQFNHRGLVRGGARGASAPTDISQSVRRAPPQSDYPSLKAPIS